jgi:hypothetical protein
VKSPLPEAISVTLLVTQALDELGVDYVVGGSVASSVYCVPRSTADADVIAALREEHVAPLVASLEGAFYVDADMIRDAIRHRFEFNVLHLATMFKVDVFVPRLDEVVRRELSRGSRLDVGEGKSFVVASAEDRQGPRRRHVPRGRAPARRGAARARAPRPAPAAAVDDAVVGQAVGQAAVGRPAGDPVT